MVAPFEATDASFAAAAARAGAYPVLHLGHDPAKAEKELKSLAKSAESFAVCVTSDIAALPALPKNVTAVIAPWGAELPEKDNPTVPRVWQVHSAEEIEAALSGVKPRAVIVKGAEGAGRCGEESTLLLFRRAVGACEAAGVPVYVQGGVGTRAGAAYIALGAAGVVMDSQLALMPECGASAEEKAVLGRLNGSEIQMRDGFNGYKRLGAGHADEEPLPLGQDVILAADLTRRHRNLKGLVRAFDKAVVSHLRLARARDGLAVGGPMASDLGAKYPLVQGPMARISDVPAFLAEVADNGALPVLAMSMATGDAAAAMLKETARVLEGKPWGAGILGFAYPSVVEDQTRRIIECKPNAVVIAGGRPAQARQFEQAGIKAFLHVPSPGILDMFLKEGACNFIFEGRESGGHVGPLFSTVLWEAQIERLISAKDPSKLSALFAGGICDEFSAAFIRVMAAPLAARDAKVGLQAGTAYLYTDEAVETGAITPEYRELLENSKTTLLLKSGAGQETRAVPSAFTEFFLSEKERMEKEGMETAAVLLKLEDLNLGRLRIASKGVTRIEDEIVPVAKEERLKDGLYMTGAVTALLDKPLKMAALHEAMIIKSGELVREAAKRLSERGPERGAKKGAKTAASGYRPDIDVAVVGMAGVFPAADDLDEYWRNIIMGRDSITEVSPDRWPADLFYDPDARDTDHVVSKWGGFISPVDFNALEFGITPQSLASIEPVQLLSLLMAKRALEDAGYTDLNAVDLSETSVIFGAQGAGDLTTAYGSRAGLMHMFGEMPGNTADALPKLTEDSFPGVLSNVIAGRISNRLNTGGRNYTVDAACASSLAALDVAMMELAAGKSDMVILGGADLHNGINDFLMFSSTHALSRKGYCSTFDAEADGIALGEGVGVMVLKRLGDAERDGNRIYAVIKGVGGSSDGKNLGLTAPSKNGQREALDRAYENTGIDPADVGMIEAHGTGTAMGDRTELSALTDLFLDAGAGPARAQLGSVKTQIGHTKCAAGVASLIKAVLSVRHGLLPPTLHIKRPNEAYTPGSPFFFRTEKPGLWMEQRRLAGVSGFGFGGTNFHALVENYRAGWRKEGARDASCDTPPVALRAWPAELFVFRGEKEEDAFALMDRIKALCAVNNKLRLRDIALSLAIYGAAPAEGEASAKPAAPIQYAVVAGSAEELLARMEDAQKGRSHENLAKLKPLEGKVAFLFSGQGSQRVNMAADLFVLFPQTRRLLGRYPEYEKLLFAPSVFSEEGKKARNAAVTDTRNAQPLLGFVSTAIAELLGSFGVKPDLVAGHSYGELPALAFAGALPTEELAEISRARAEAILGAVGEDPGRMAAARGDAKTLAGLLADESKVWAVNLNAPKQTVIAGASAEMEAFLKKLDEQNIAYSELNVACAFHSPLLDGADKSFARTLSKTRVGSPKMPVWSNTTAEIYPSDPEAVRERLAKHLVSPVRFEEELRAMYHDGARVFIEAGPGSTLVGLTSQILKGEEIAAIQTEQRGADGLTVFLRALAAYVATGRELEMEKLFEGRDAKPLDIDNTEANRKTGIVWNIDGERAVPENGPLPAHAGLARSEIVLDMPGRRGSGDVSPENVMMAYLGNLNAMIMDQRDVMLGYLGNPNVAARAPRAPLAAGPMGEPQAQAYVQPMAVYEAAPALEAPMEDADAQSVLPSITELTSEQVQALIFSAVSEKTGYPVDMLESDMELEADLSIDSIKKMEIVGALRERIAFPNADEADMDAFFERMISVKTFRDLADWIEEMGRAVAEGTTVKSDASEGFAGATLAAGVEDGEAEEPQAKPAESGNDGDTGIVRMILEAKPRPLEEPDDDLIKGKLFAIRGGNGLAEALAAELERRGAKARIVKAGDDISDCDGLALVNLSDAKERLAATDLFALLKTADMKKIEWVCAVGDAEGAALSSGGFADGLPEGFTGFIKTMHHEYPGKRFLAISFQTKLGLEAAPGLIVDELANVDPFPEVFYKEGERFLLLPRIARLAKEGEADARPVAQPVKELLELGEDAVIVVSGGAQGITPHLVSRLAQTLPARYVLFGRTEAEEPDPAYAELESVSDIRSHIIEHEGPKKPREVEDKARAIFKAKQIAAAVKLIEDNGGKAEYRSVNVRDAKALRDALEQIKKEYGRVDGLIHAAGVLEDKRFRDKEAASFGRVFGTKTEPLSVVFDVLPELKLLVMFSSMASAFGNAGQVDYAAGNSVMDGIARALSGTGRNLRVVAFGWGPWKGAGMVNESLEKEFRRRGVAFLPLKEGGEFFADEILYGDDSNVLVLGGNDADVERFIASALG